MSVNVNWDLFRKLLQTKVWFPRLAPVAVCSLVAARIAAMEDVLNVIGKLALYLVTILCGLLIHSLVLLPLVFFVITRNNPYRFMKGVGDALMTAFGIASRFVACMCEHMHVKITQSNYLKRVLKGSVQPPKWSPNLKWSSTIRPRNDTDPHLHVDPEMIPITSWNGTVFLHGIITSLLQRLLSWIALNIHYSSCDFLALLSSNRLYVYFCIFKIILKY